MKKKKNEGKEFERDFKESVGFRTHIYRFKDGTSNWGGGEVCPKCKTKLDKNTSFQSGNICDFLIFSYPNLFYLELKSLKGKSFPMKNTELRKGIQVETSQKKQANQLTVASKFNGIKAGFIVNFRDEDETYYMSIELYNECSENLSTKSIPIKLFREKAIRINQMQKKVKWYYEVEKMLKDIVNG